MLLTLLLIPILAILTSLFLYRHIGKKDLFQMDVVQFLYGFVIFPLMFVWLKTLLFYILSRELEFSLSVGQMFFIDTVFTMIFLFVFAFEVIHIVTTNFNLKYYRDPLYDIFEHSEYYHLWLSHVGLYLGLMLLTTGLGVLNALIPFQLVHNKFQFYGALGLGWILGLLGFAGVWMSDFPVPQYMRLMKLSFGFFFSILIVIYFVIDPEFRMSYLFYWIILMAFASAVGCSFLFDRSTKATKIMGKLRRRDWEKRSIEAFKKTKK